MISPDLQRVIAAAALTLAPVLAQAQATQATVFTDLNLRAGPGPQYQVVGLIPADSAVDVQGCLEAANWCRVTYAGTDGWASGDYLATMVGDAPAPIYANRQQLSVATVTYEDTTAQSATGLGTIGALAGAALGGPIGAVAGAALGAGAGAAADPGPEVTSYVTTNRLEPVYLDGEVVVGAGIPANVPLTPVPDSKFVYASINGQTVVVDPATRIIKYILR